MTMGIGTLGEKAKATKDENGKEQPLTPDQIIENDLLDELRSVALTAEEVANVAREIWLRNGSPPGKDDQFWEEAEVTVQRAKFNDVLATVARRHNKTSDTLGKLHDKYRPKPRRERTSFTCWELCEEVIGNCNRVLLWGVSGTGKSWAARKANLNDTTVFSVSLTDDTPAAELRGHYGLVEGSYKWLDGPCVMAWRQGCRLCLNELEKASGDAQTFLLGILDDPEIAQQTLPTGETIRPKEGYHVVATMNGKPDEDLNPALRDRFPVCIHINEVAPPALAKLPYDVRSVAQNSGIVESVQRRISIRVWNEFVNLREKLGPTMAAQAVFGDRAKIVLDHLKLKGA